ncbi:MAG: glycine cleavage system aminomethyltransferase GcvT [Rhodospirillales bacterium]
MPAESATSMSGAPPSPLKRTPLFALHQKLGARLVPFAGYEMPVQYQGILAEHRHARTKAVLFDVSHMGQAMLIGEDVADVLETLVVGDVKDMPAGRMRYTLLTNARGGIVDDIMLIQGGFYVWLIVNAARQDVDFAHIASHTGSAAAQLQLQPTRALLALQGPAAAAVLGRLAPAARLMLFMTSEPLTVGGIKCWISRSGYTGEDGYEISVEAEDAEALARLLLAEPEVAPAGLGARDTLRLEAGLCLYGNDIDEETTPIEAALAWTVHKRRRTQGGFPGATTILGQLVEGVARRRVGIRLDGKQPARAGAPILNGDGQAIGRVTSGTLSPTLGQPIAMGYVDRKWWEPGTPVQVVVRDKPLAGQVVRMPFVEHRYAKPV